MLREALSRLAALERLSRETILHELNATLRRREEARIYAWVKKTGEYPPSRLATPSSSEGPAAPGGP